MIRLITSTIADNIIIYVARRSQRRPTLPLRFEGPRNQVECLCTPFTVVTIKNPDGLSFAKLIVRILPEGNKVKFEIPVLGEVFIS